MAFTEGVHYWEVICPITCNTIRKSIILSARNIACIEEILTRNVHISRIISARYS